MNSNDRRIERELVEHLHRDSAIDDSDVLMEVREGAVTLRGTVPTYFARTELLQRVWEVQGVRSVDSRIHVKPREEVPAPVDGEIEQNVTALLQLNPEIEPDDIRVKVNEGRVILEGSVDAYWKQECAETLAAHVRGVVEIQNRLVVLPHKRRVDLEIAEDILDALERGSRMDADSIAVRVAEGMVELSGTVPTEAARRAAVHVAKHTIGVMGVQDRMRVAAREPASA